MNTIISKVTSDRMYAKWVINFKHINFIEWLMDEHKYTLKQALKINALADTTIYNPYYKKSNI